MHRFTRKPTEPMCATLSFTYDVREIRHSTLVVTTIGSGADELAAGEYPNVAVAKARAPLTRERTSAYAVACGAVSREPAAPILGRPQPGPANAPKV